MPKSRMIRNILFALMVSCFVLGTFSTAMAAKINTGKIIEEEGTVMLLTGKGKFLLEGPDFSEHVGKVARIAGKVEEKDGAKVIQVEKYTIIKSQTQ